MWYHEYDYDAEGRPVSVTAYDGGGAQIGYLEYRYTPEGLGLHYIGAFLKV